ncbi:acetoacetyl-CoA synthetase-like [Macrobrachium nipponense]|uniref:acetoacetyl-CoA synthetase-like n=1 Tax=Macrobrachium nipponense TaxID=159736 RepID=UPI0030C8B625
MSGTEDLCLWKPDPRRKTKLDDFREHVNKKYNLRLGDYHDLYKWSVDKYSEFWETWWNYGQFIYSSPSTQTVDTSLDITQVPRWFAGAKLNFAENLLRFQDERVALYATGEGQKGIASITYKQLYKHVGSYARALKGCGVSAGDRVVGYMPNCLQTVEAMLGTAAIGAVWSSTSPDFGVTGVLERFSQIDPTVLFTVDAVVYNGKVHDHLNKVKKVMAGLKHLKKVVIVPFVHKKEEIDISDIPKRFQGETAAGQGSSASVLSGTWHYDEPGEIESRPRSENSLSRHGHHRYSSVKGFSVGPEVGEVAEGVTRFPVAARSVSSSVADASLASWGAHLGGLVTLGVWGLEDKLQHINVLELKAAFLGLKEFREKV